MIELGHSVGLVFSSPFFMLLTHFYPKRRNKHLREGYQKKTVLCKCKGKKKTSVAMTTVS